MLGIAVWAVFCLGIGAFVVSSGMPAKGALVEGAGVSALLWSIGVGIWQGVAWIA